MDPDGLPPAELAQELNGFQIFFIVLSGTVGGGIFNENGEALEIAGPAGMILSVIVLGIITICMSEGVSELTQIFPAPNAIVQYVRTFVDEDFAWVIGVAYWYTFASIFAVENISAANYTRYWGFTQTGQTLCFYFATPVIILGINFCGVRLFGIIETIGGFIKVCLVFGVSIVFYIVADKNQKKGIPDPINDGFQDNKKFARSRADAILYVIPLVAYGYLGTEMITMTAFEARAMRSLRLPSQLIGYAITFLYLLCTIGEALNIDWISNHLEVIYGSSGQNTPIITKPSSASLPVVATWQGGYYTLAGVINGFLIFTVLSASNTALYIASRTLYGMTREVPTSNVIGKILRTISMVVPKTKVPAAALVISAISFFWLPFLELDAGFAIQDLIYVIALTSSVTCMLAWAALSLAFIRYELWLKKCRAGLVDQGRTEYIRDSKDYKPFTVFAWAQPIPAYIALIGSCLIFGCTSASWWDSPVTFTKVAVAYLPHGLLFALWIILKVINRRWWVSLDEDPSELLTKLSRLEFRKKKDRDRTEPERPQHELQEISFMPPSIGVAN